MLAFAERSQKEMLSVLLDPGAPGPDVHYYMLRGGAEKKNITIWEAGTVGGEYIKTFGHYHVSDFIETYEVLAGVGIILLQAPVKDDKVEWVRAIYVSTGSRVAIPEHAGHLGVNIGKSWLVTSDDSPVYDADDPAAPKHADYEPVRRMRGFAYYIVEKEGKPSFVKNPNYKNHPHVVIEEA